MEKAGEQALARFANREAMTFFTEALALAQQSQGAVEIEIFARLGATYNLAQAQLVLESIPTLR